MGKAFYDTEQKRMKLDRTVCLYKGEPYFVYVPEGRVREFGQKEKPHEVQLFQLGEPHRKPHLTVDYTEEDFDYKPFALGYSNFQGQAVYVTRSPDRQNSQGLSANCIVFRPDLQRTSEVAWLQSRACYETIKGIYPSLQECLDAVHPYSLGKNSMAFDRHFAIRLWDNNMRLLCYRGRNIGFWSNGAVVFFDAKDLSLVKIAARKAGIKC